MPLASARSSDFCLAKGPEDRYASTRDLARELQSIRDHISDVTSSAVQDLKTAPALDIRLESESLDRFFGE
jgi:hypothetical protein